MRAGSRRPNEPGGPGTHVPIPQTPPTPMVPGGSAGGGGSNPGSVFNQGAFDAMYQLLEEYGLSSLSGFLRNLILSGVTDSASSP